MAALRVLTKADIVLMVLLILLGLGLSFVTVSGQHSGELVKVSVDGKLYGTYDLNRDRQVLIEDAGHSNKFIIKDGTVQMIQADCHNKICIRQGAISKTGQTIVCLPNRVAISIQGGEGYDAVSH